jgi:hypothetical protein
MSAASSIVIRSALRVANLTVADPSIKFASFSALCITQTHFLGPLFERFARDWEI